MATMEGSTSFALVNVLKRLHVSPVISVPDRASARTSDADPGALVSVPLAIGIAGMSALGLPLSHLSRVPPESPLQSQMVARPSRPRELSLETRAAAASSPKEQSARNRLASG